MLLAGLRGPNQYDSPMAPVITNHIYCEQQRQTVTGLSVDCFVGSSGHTSQAKRWHTSGIAGMMTTF